MLERALEWSEYVDSHRIKIRNRPDIYGRQVIMNALDEEIGELEHLLLDLNTPGKTRKPSPGPMTVFAYSRLLLPQRHIHPLMVMLLDCASSLNDWLMTVMLVIPYCVMVTWAFE